MSLFGTLLKQGIKAADGLLDDVAVQSKKAVDHAEAQWLIENPRPHPDVRYKDMSPDQVREYNAWNKRLNLFRAKRRPDWDSKQKEITRKARERRQSINGGLDPLQANYPSFDYDRYNDLYPRPEGEPTSKAVKSWLKQRRDAAQKSATKGFDSLGNALMREMNPRLVEFHSIHGQRPHQDIPASLRTEEQRKEVKRFDSTKERFLRKDDPEWQAIHAEAHHAMRASRALRNMPWAPRESLLDIHRFAKELQMESGVPMDVDHAIPMHGDYVSGLNVPNNLQVMTADWHSGKNYTYDPALDSLFQTPLAQQNNYVDHQVFLSDYADEIAQAIADKQAVSQGAAERLNHEIIDPHTKVGRNAKILWGDDYNRYVEGIRKQIGLLGV